MYDQPFHLLAFYTNDLASDASNVSLGTVTDQAWTFNSTGYFMPENLKLWAAYAGNDAFTAVRINQPSLRDPFLPYIEPFSLTTLPGNTPPVYKAYEMGVSLGINEYLQVQGSRGTVVASDAYALLWVGKQRRAIPSGPRRTIRFTSAITIAEGVWTLGAMTFSDTLPDGKFAIVGMNVYGTNALAARLAFTGGGWRPGVICQGAQGEWVQPAFARDELGYYGSFLNTIQPNLEVFGVGAGASQIGYLDLVQVG
jgi:hypothetical protein